MPALDLAQWAIDGVKDETGTGRMAQNLKHSLRPVRQIVAPSYRHAPAPLAGGDSVLVSDAPDPTLRDQLAACQGIIVFEDTDWSRRAVRLAHEAGVKTVYVVLWEWLRFYVAEWQLCDLLVCPNRMALDVARRLGFRRTVQLTWPLNLEALPKREITGPARTFVHNAGLIEPDDRKGTAITIEAFRNVPRRDVELLVHVQNECALGRDEPRVRIESCHLPDHAELYRHGDVAVQPSKCEGLGFMLLEAIAAGLPVITADYPPMNEYVRQREMRVATRWGRQSAEQTSYIHQAHFKIPRISDLTRKMNWCARHDLAPISAANRHWAEKTFAAEKVRREWTDALGRILR